MLEASPFAFEAPELAKAASRPGTNLCVQLPGSPATSSFGRLLPAPLPDKRMDRLEFPQALLSVLAVGGTVDPPRIRRIEVPGDQFLAELVLFLLYAAEDLA